MTNSLSKQYHNTFGRFFECAKLYRTDLYDFKQKIEFERVGNFSFFMPGKNEMTLFNRFYGNSIKMKIIEKRVESDDYLCFAYRDDKTGEIAYARWLCKNQFYSDTMRKQLYFETDEAFTLDSYTHPDYRYLGLHKKMNILILQWIKSNTEIRWVYMVIKCLLPHLTKIPRQLGYKPIEKILYYKKGSLLKNLKFFIKKLSFSAKII